jgi:hypothetical protein
VNNLNTDNNLELEVARLAYLPAEAALVVPEADESGIVARLENVHRLLAEVVTVPQAKEALAAAKAVEIYAKETKTSAAILRLAFRFRSLAKRRLGETIVRMQEAGELEARGGDRKSKSTASTLKLRDLGISKDESAQAQAFASVSEEAFERMLGDAGSEELSDAALLRRIRAAKAEGSPPSKRRGGKAKGTPPAKTPIDDAPAPTPLAVSKVSLKIALENAEALKKVVGVLKAGADDWKKGSLTPLMENTSGNARIAAALELVGKDLDALVEMVEVDRDALVERFLGFAREVAS